MDDENRSQEAKQIMPSEALESLRSIFRETTTKEVFEAEWDKVLKKSPDSESMIFFAATFFKHHVGIEERPYKWEVIRDKTNSLSASEGLRYINAFIGMGKHSYYAGTICYNKTGVFSSTAPYESIVEAALEKRQILEIALRTENTTPKRRPSDSISNKINTKIRWEKSEAGLVYLFELLYKERLITQSSYDKRFVFMEEFFENKDGKAFNRRQSSQAETNSRNNNNPKHRGKPRDASQIETIVSALRKSEE